MLLFVVFNTLAYLYCQESGPLATLLFRICIYLLNAGIFCSVLLVDWIRSESFDPLKIALACILITASVLISLEPNAVTIDKFPNGEYGVFQSFNLSIINIFVYLYAGILIIYYTTKIYLNTPKTLKIYSGLYLLGILIMGIGGVAVFAFRLPLKIPAIHSIIFAIMMSITSVPYALKPELGFVLPFRIQKLTIIEAKSGLPLFSYAWTKSDIIIDEQLFSGMLQGIGSILSESLQKGNIREVHLDKAILLVREQYPIFCVLLGTKSTRSLRYALSSFTKQFYSEYSPYFDKFQQTDSFTTATNLVEDLFAFVPKYD